MSTHSNDAVVTPAVVHELVALFGDGELVQEVLVVLLYVQTGKGQLAEYVDDKYVGLTRAERARIHARLHRMRARALARIEKVFGGDLGIGAGINAA